jgi:hypothetical protein
MSKLCFINAEYSIEQSKNASTILNKIGNLSHGEFDRVSTPMNRRPLPKDVLTRNLKEAGGISVPELVRRAAAKGQSIAINTINAIINGATTDPRLFTIEAIAAGLDKAPEQLAAEFLGIRAEDSNFKGSQFAILHDIYKGLTPEQKRKAEIHIEGLLTNLQHVKAQAK